MFTGIIETVGRVARLEQLNAEWRIEVATSDLDLSDVIIGDSIAVSGCCLTVVKLGSASFSADVSNESMRCTNLGSLKIGSRVNLEKAMLASSRFGGHIVSGHVDGVGQLLSADPDGQSVVLKFRAPEELARYIAAKGSICIDGTSLTVNRVAGNEFAVNVIPHTQQATVIGDYQPGREVNLEVDVIARYLERMMQNEHSSEKAQAENISRSFLEQNGFGSK